MKHGGMFTEHIEGGAYKLSWARVGSFMSLLAVICWGSYVVYHSKAMPDLVGATVFVLSLYAADKAKAGVSDWKNGRASMGETPEETVEKK